MITKRLTSNTQHILKAKFHFFLRKSLIKYIFATFIIGFVLPLSPMGGLASGTLYFVGLMALVVPLLIISAKIQGKNTNFDADVSFYDDKIIVDHRNKELSESKDWTWIKEIRHTKNDILLIVNEARPFGIFLTKSKLTKNEIDFFDKRV